MKSDFLIFVYCLINVMFYMIVVFKCYFMIKINIVIKRKNSFFYFIILLFIVLNYWLKYFLKLN